MREEAGQFELAAWLIVPALTLVALAWIANSWDIVDEWEDD